MHVEATMQLEFRTKSTWRPLVVFFVSEVEAVKAAALVLAAASHQAGEPMELRIKDAMDVVVLALMHPLGWQVPKSAKGYEWLP